MAVAPAFPHAGAFLELDARENASVEAHAWPWCATKSLKYVFSPADVHRSFTLQPPGSCVTLTRSMPFLSAIPEPLPIRRSRPSIDAGCTMLSPAHAYFQRMLPSDGETPIAPGPFTRTICATPSMVDRCGELYPQPSFGPYHLGLPDTASYAASHPPVATMTTSPTTSGELAMPQSGIFFPVSDAAFRDQMTEPSPASSALRTPVAPSV